jgi:hypothetical protein
LLTVVAESGSKLCGEWRFIWTELVRGLPGKPSTLRSRKSSTTTSERPPAKKETERSAANELLAHFRALIGAALVDQDGHRVVATDTELGRSGPRHSMPYRSAQPSQTQWVALWSKATAPS